MNAGRTTTSISVRDILTIVFRRKVPIGLVTIVVIVATLTIASRVRSVYEASAKVLIRRTGATPLATTWTPFYGLEEEMNTEVELVSTDIVLEKALEELLAKGSVIRIAKGKKFVTREPTMDDLRAGVSAAPVEMSNILLVKFTGADPSFVKEAADAIANAYVEHRSILRKASAIDAYFQDQIREMETRLVGLKQQELELRKQGEIYDLEWQYRMTINRRTEIETSLSKVRSRKNAEENKLALLKQRLADTTSILNPIAEFDQDDLGQEMLLEYWKLLKERDAAASTMTPNSPTVRMLDERIAKVKQRFKEELQRRINAKELLLKDLKAEEDAYMAEIERINSQLRATPDIVAEITHLEREINYTYKHYDRLLEKLLDTVTSEANDTRLANAKVVSPAVIRITRAGKMQSVYILFSILLGVILGLGFGLLLENMDHSVKSAVDVEDVLGLPLLGSIPEIRDGIGARRILKSMQIRK